MISKGEIPAARINLRAIPLDSSRFAVMGGIGSEVYNDFKVYDYTLRDWKYISYSNEHLIDIPDVRNGHTLNLWGDQLVLFAGGGP